MITPAGLRWDHSPIPGKRSMTLGMTIGVVGHSRRPKIITACGFSVLRPESLGPTTSTVQTSQR